MNEELNKKKKAIINLKDKLEKINLSQQYMADGKQWINVKNRDTIYPHRVVAWKEIE